MSRQSHASLRGVVVLVLVLAFSGAGAAARPVGANGAKDLDLATSADLGWSAERKAERGPAGDGVKAGTSDLALRAVAERRAALDGVHADHGVLVFRDQAAVDNALAALQDMSREEADRWEATRGFVSQRQIFDRVVDAEYNALVRPFEGMTEADLAGLTPPEHSREYRRALADGIIEEVDDTYDYALTMPPLARLIDARGFFAVGGTIYQAQGNTLRQWAQAELDGPGIFGAVKTDGIEGVIESLVPGLDEGPSPGPMQPLATYGTFSKSTNWITSGKRRGLMSVTFIRSFSNPYPWTKVTTSYFVNVQSQRKNAWGNWVYPSCPNECWISGTWTSDFRLISAVTLGYAFSDYSNSAWAIGHPNCLNNWSGSFRPRNGGAGVSPYVTYGTTFTYGAPAGYAFSEVSISPMTWSASVPGGSSGISLSITN